MGHMYIGPIGFIILVTILYMTFSNEKNDEPKTYEDFKKQDEYSEVVGSDEDIY